MTTMCYLCSSTVSTANKQSPLPRLTTPYTVSSHHALNVLINGLLLTVLKLQPIPCASHREASEAEIPLLRCH